jgi:hypothetical protein
MLLDGVEKYLLLSLLGHAVDMVAPAFFGHAKLIVDAPLLVSCNQERILAPIDLPR